MSSKEHGCSNSNVSLMAHHIGLKHVSVPVVTYKRKALIFLKLMPQLCSGPLSGSSCQPFSLKAGLLVKLTTQMLLSRQNLTKKYTLNIPACLARSPAQIECSNFTKVLTRPCTSEILNSQCLSSVPRTSGASKGMGL